MWKYSEWFGVPANGQPDSVIVQAEEYLVQRHIEHHPFFLLAAARPDALKVWVSQEVVVTGEFSQLLLSLAADIKNVHLRAMVVSVVVGEHGIKLKNGIANLSHPWLLHTLRESLGISEESVVPLPETEEFLAVLREECRDPLCGLAALGVGNERMLIPEYTAVKNSFAKCCPSAKYQAFLDANIQDDREHYALMSTVAAALIGGGGAPDAYLQAAVRSVDARFSFYDRLLARLRQEEL